MTYDGDLITDVIEDMEENGCDRLVLLIVESRKNPTMKTRIQKESLIFNQLYTSKREHEAYYFGGYSDDIDESYTNLADVGLLSSERGGFVLTGFGKAVVNRLHSVDRSNMCERVMKMERSLSNIDDRTLVAITYKLFPKMAENSTIKGTVEPIIESLSINGKKLNDWSSEEFLDCVRNGTEMIPERNK